MPFEVLAYNAAMSVANPDLTLFNLVLGAEGLANIAMGVEVPGQVASHPYTDGAAAAGDLTSSSAGGSSLVGNDPGNGDSSGGMGLSDSDATVESQDLGAGSGGLESAT